MIEARGLTKRYGSTLAVDDLSFDVREGRVTGFLGPNGAGKSTTLRMVMGLDAPTKGTVTIGGRPYTSLRRPLFEVGAMLEASAIHDGRSAYNHLLCVAQSNGIGRRRVEEVLGLVGLTSVAKRRAGKFSMGMSQRLGIGVALLGDPELLIFDEPVNGLDPEGIVWIRNLMRSLAAEGRTVFVSSHLMAEMALTADHVIVIGRGRLLAEVSVEALIHGSSQNFVRVRSPHNDKLATLLDAQGGSSHADPDAVGALAVIGMSASAIGDLAAAEGIVLHELSPQEASLEEAYLELTRDSVEYRADAPGEEPRRRQHPRSGRWHDMTVTAIPPMGATRGLPPAGRTVTNVLASEWTKIRSVRSTYWTLLAAAGTTIGLSAIVCAVFVAQYSHLTPNDKATFNPASFSLIGGILAQLAIAVLGVIVVTAEYASGMIRTTFAAVPRRLSVLAAKATVFTAVTLAVTTTACFVAFFIGQGILSAKNVGVSIGAPGAVRTVVGTGLYLAVLGLLALGLGTLIRKTAGAITAMFGIIFVLPVLAGLLPSSMNAIEKFLPTTAGQAIINGSDTARSGADSLSPWVGLAVFFLYAVVILGAAAFTLVHRDA